MLLFVKDIFIFLVVNEKQGWFNSVDSEFLASYWPTVFERFFLPLGLLPFGRKFANPGVLK
jgi:hypothetical protein